MRVHLLVGVGGEGSNCIDMAMAWVGSNEGKKWSEYSDKQRDGP